MSGCCGIMPWDSLAGVCGDSRLSRRLLGNTPCERAREVSFAAQGSRNTQLVQNSVEPSQQRIVDFLQKGSSMGLSGYQSCSWVERCMSAPCILRRSYSNLSVSM